MSKQFVFDAFDNKETTRVPVGFWFHFAPDQLFVNDPEVRRKNIEGHQKYFDEFHPDFVKLMSDGYFHYPNPTLETITSVEDLKKAKSGLVDEWIDQQVSLVKELTDRLHGETATFYNLFAPVTVLGFALEDSGNQLTLAKLVKEAPQELAYALNVIKQDLAKLAVKIITDGKADGIYLSTKNIQDPTITAEEYHTLITPSEQGVLNAANAVSDYNILHICGYEGARNNLSIYKDYDVKVINWAAVVEEVSLKEGKALFGGRAVIGGFDNTKNSVLYRGTKEEIQAEAKRLLDEAGTTGVILGADCTIPENTPIEHLNWVREAAQEYGR
ncbi:MAG: uroporphyrinogen decarboxylase family protein [Lachnospiraceae bacterium]|nr:uroporphyrinogen decarboxylase family protein [Lachnospiraceae bacterium]